VATRDIMARGGMPMTPPELILSFIARQPQPIRDNLYFAVVFPFKGRIGASETDYEQLAKEVLSEGVHTRRFWRALFVVAAMDHHLSRPHDELECAWEYIPEEAKLSQTLTMMHLQAPLRRKYLDAAHAEWLQLRQSNLSSQALHKYEQTLLVLSLDKLLGN
jgi:hypothetical protein